MNVAGFVGMADEELIVRAMRDAQSLLASAFGFATGIANADKIDITTNTHAARLIKNRRRIRPSFLAASCGIRRMFWRAESSLALWPQQVFGPGKPPAERAVTWAITIRR